MIIGIDASRAFVKNKTGIEEYSYRVIKHLRQDLKDQQVILYTRPGGEEQVDFELPKNWQVRVLSWKYFWTQIALSLELFLNPIDILFVPAHTLPFVHPKNSIVTIHGLEYEFSPESYSFYSRLFHRFFIKKSCRWAKNIIAVSNKTKKDLTKLYNVSQKTIQIIPNGFDFVQADVITENNVISKNKPFLFFIGRLEERKNIVGIIKTFEILKEKYNYPGRLLLSGRQGYGYDKIKKSIQKSKFKKDIKQLGFLDDSKKWSFIKGADLFMFPSHSEGFGIPIVEAQSMGTPVITSNKSPMKETIDDERALADPDQPAQIAKVANKILQNEDLRDSIIEKGLENIKKYSWKKTAKQIAEVLKS